MLPRNSSVSGWRSSMGVIMSHLGAAEALAGKHPVAATLL
jgi:hypothetical protein